MSLIDAVWLLVLIGLAAALAVTFVNSMFKDES